MATSKMTQIGQAGVYFVLYDLTLQGYDAFLAAEGMPYDVVVDVGGKLRRIQVKTTIRLISPNKSQNIYRFGTRKAKGARRRTDVNDIDYFACVALDVVKIGYVPIKQMIGKDGKIKNIIEFRTRRLKYNGYGKYLEDHQIFRGK